MPSSEALLFRGAEFQNCKMIGLDFTSCSPFLLELEFDQCALDYCLFGNLEIANTAFKHCRLIDTDFTKTDLSGAIFTGSNLSGAHFENTLLVNADFREAVSFNIDPEINNLRKAKFEKEQLDGLLQKYSLDII